METVLFLVTIVFDEIRGMFTGFWVIEFDFFQSDPNINSDPISFNRAR